MATLTKRLPANAPGDFFVDSTCIDCDLCRQIAPSVFAAHGDLSVVYHQPENPEEALRAGMALVTCPTASIGTREKHDFSAAVKAFPELITENIYACGFAAQSSYGASSYLILRPNGNVLVDSPRFNERLARRIGEMGGVALMILTHRDDVADHAKFHNRFGCERVIHEMDSTRSTNSAERKLSGGHPIQLGDDLLVVPTPGHTPGHQVILYNEKFLFGGDHLWWSEQRGRLHASPDVCWYSWPEQVRSMERLQEFRFEWVLPGHGRRHQASPEEMRHSLRKCIDWMKRG